MFPRFKVVTITRGYRWFEYVEVDTYTWEEIQRFTDKESADAECKRDNEIWERQERVPLR